MSATRKGVPGIGRIKDQLIQQVMERRLRRAADSSNAQPAGAAERDYPEAW